MAAPRIVEIHEAVQGRNNAVAARNRRLFAELGITVVNVMSAPGSGKTEFLARTLADAAVWGPAPSSNSTSVPTFIPPAGPNLTADAPRRLRTAVIVGDIATDNDAKRLSRTGAEVVQITTGGYCHLDAGMVAQAADGMNLCGLDVLIIENVGNMVCPATFDLGESVRVALLSVTEGEDKPLKYPTLFQRADVVILNKIDLSDAVEFDRAAAMGNLRRVAPDAHVFEVSARTGRGMSRWYDYLRARATGDNLDSTEDRESTDLLVEAHGGS
ncbi:MAG: hydrogenase nickel incorporation protein HypB [Capsulimonadaceae bacterium]